MYNRKTSPWLSICTQYFKHDDVIKWKAFPCYWPFVRVIHLSPMDSPHKHRWRGTLMSSMICAWINSWLNKRKAGDTRRHRAHYDVIVLPWQEAASVWIIIPDYYIINIGKYRFRNAMDFDIINHNTMTLKRSLYYWCYDIGGSPSQKATNREISRFAFVDLRKLLSRPSSWRLCETPRRPCDITVI